MSTEANEPELVTLGEVPTAVVHDVIPMEEMVGFFDSSFSELSAVLGRQGVAPAGAAFARYAGPPGETADLEVGFPVQEPVTPEGNVRPSSLPGGRVARVVHVGGYEQLGHSWGRLGAWMAAEGLTPGSDMWEVYVTEPQPGMDPTTLHTELYWTIA